MRQYLIFLMVLGLYACKKEHKLPELTKNYTQTASIQLVNPMVEVDNLIIDQESKITISLGLAGTSMYYTVDGSVPTEDSKKYTGIVSVGKPGVYKFRAFHNDFKPSETEEVVFLKKSTTTPDIRLISALHEQYKGEGKYTLVNHQRGTKNFRDGQWIGMTEPLEAEIDFKTSVFLESLDIGFMVNSGAWIFPIDEVFIAVSENGINFTPFEITAKAKKINKDTSRLDHLQIPISRKIKKMKIKITNVSSLPEWHQGKGNAAWLFVDEWIFNTRNE